MKKITHPSYIGNLPIDANLDALSTLLSCTNYRLFRRGRGVRKNKSSPSKDWKGNPSIRTDFQAHLPLSIAESQALYLRGRGYSGSSVCVNKNLIRKCRDMVRAMGGTVNA